PLLPTPYIYNSPDAPEIVAPNPLAGRRLGPQPFGALAGGPGAEKKVFVGTGFFPILVRPRVDANDLGIYWRAQRNDRRFRDERLLMPRPLCMTVGASPEVAPEIPGFAFQIPKLNFNPLEDPEPTPRDPILFVNLSMRVDAIAQNHISNDSAGALSAD